MRFQLFHGVKSMVKSELVKLLGAHQPQLTPRDVELAVNCIIEQMAQALETGDDVEIRGFGHFTVRQRPPRRARNPKTGEAVDLEAKAVVHFRPGKALRERVDAGRGQYRIKDL